MEVDGTMAYEQPCHEGELACLDYCVLVNKAGLIVEHNSRSCMLNNIATIRLKIE